MAKKLAFDQFLRYGSAVYIDQRLMCPMAQLVNGAGYEFLSGPVFAHDQDPCIGGCGNANLLLQGLNWRTVSSNRIFFKGLLAQVAVFLFKLPEVEGIVNSYNNLFYGERFFDKIVGSQFRGLNSRFNCSVT